MIAIIANNRATVGRMKALYETMLERGMEVSIVVGCSAWDTNEVDTPYRIQALMDGDNNASMANTTSAYAMKLEAILALLKPTLAIIHGDRYEQLGAAYVCAYMGIPIAHTEGGDASGSIDGKVRWAISALSDYHFPVTPRSKKNLIHAFPTKAIIEDVGSTGIDLLRRWEDVANEPKKVNPYVLVLHHPDTETHESITPIIRAVLNECGAFGIKWVNANIDAGSRAMMKEVHKYNVDFVKNLPNDEFFCLMKGSSLCIGNSSSFIKEASYLGKRAVIVGSRQYGREVGGNVVLVDNLQKEIEVAISKALAKGDCGRSLKFGDGHSCERICDILASKHRE